MIGINDGNVIIISQIFKDGLKKKFLDFLIFDLHLIRIFPFICKKFIWILLLF